MHHILYFLLILAVIEGCDLYSKQDNFPQTPAPGTKDSRKENEKTTSMKYEAVAVVELFTSQGCSSCPPADRLLAEISREAAQKAQNIFTLSFHVDYWNYIGWRDPYSDAAYSNRQRNYAQAFGSGRIYTPQMIVNGKWEFVGSSRSEAQKNTERALSAPSLVKIELNRRTSESAGELIIAYTISGGAGNAVLNLALLEKHTETNITRGENSGRVLKHSNVVRLFKTVDIQQSKTGIIRLRKPENLAEDNFTLIGYVQHAQSLEILGAGKL